MLISASTGHVSTKSACVHDDYDVQTLLSQNGSCLLTNYSTLTSV